jgi:hypothetical protein
VVDTEVPCGAADNSTVETPIDFKGLDLTTMAVAADAVAAVPLADCVDQAPTPSSAVFFRRCVLAAARPRRFKCLDTTNMMATAAAMPARATPTPTAIAAVRCWSVLIAALLLVGTGECSVGDGDTVSDVAVSTMFDCTADVTSLDCSDADKDSSAEAIAVFVFGTDTPGTGDDMSDAISVGDIVIVTGDWASVPDDVQLEKADNVTAAVAYGVDSADCDANVDCVAVCDCV